MLKLFLIFFFVLNSKADSTCTPYQCDSSSSSVSGCVRKDISSMKLTECKADYECTGQDLLTTDNNFGRCNLLEGKDLRSVDDYCYYEANCATSYCLNYVCSVKELGDSCSSDDQCTTFMKCFQSQCYSRLHVGELCPTSGKDLCRELSQCVKLNDDFDYKCQALFSVAAGEKVTAAIGETVDGTICETGEINTTSMTCYPSVNAHSEFPKQCSSSTDCSGSVSGTQSECVCHYINKEGNKYCTPFPSERGTFLNDSIAKAKKNYSDCANWQHVLGSPSTCDVDISEEQYIEDWIPTKNLRDSCYAQVNLTDYIYSEIPDLATCPKFSCVDDSKSSLETTEDVKIQYENCIQYATADSTFYLKKCPDGYNCPKDTLYLGNSPKTIQCIQDYEHKNAYNKLCLRNSECYSGICNMTSYKCTYLEDGKVCTTSYECGQNSQCYQEKCQKNLDIGFTCTSVDYSLCPPLSQCALYEGIDYFQCQPLYQLNSTISEFKLLLDGEQISSANIPFAYRDIFDSMCESGYFNQTTKVCSDKEQKVEKGYPLVCTSDEDCVSSETAEDGECACETNIYGNKYCKGFTADQIPNYFSLYHTFALKNLSKCFYYELAYENVGVSNDECNVGKFKRVKNVPEAAIGTCYAAVLGGEFAEEEESDENSSQDNLTENETLNESKSSAQYLSACLAIAILVAQVLF